MRGTVRYIFRVLVANFLVSIYYLNFSTFDLLTPLLDDIKLVKIGWDET